MDATDQLIEAALTHLGVGEHCRKDSVRRVRSWVEEWKKDAATEPKLYFEKTVKVDEMVVVTNIEFASLCEHHLLPFVGRVDIGYFPSDKGVLGVSKFSRIVDHFAHKPQLQERLTDEIATFLREKAETPDVAVRMNAQHLCARIRGVKQPNLGFVTQVVHGKFRENSDTRAEFLRQIG